MRRSKIVLLANTDWYLFNFRLALAEHLRDCGHDVVLASPPGVYGDKMLSLGFEWRSLPMKRRSLNPLREFALLFHLARLFRAERPDIVHGFTIKGAVYAAIAAKAAGIRAVVNSIDGLGFVFISNRLKARLLRPMVRTAMRIAFSGPNSRVVVLNPTDRIYLSEARIVRDDKIRLIPGAGVDCTAFVPPAEQPRGDGPLRVLLPGRLLWDKGIGEFVEASRLLSHKNICFQIAGAIDDGNPAAISRQQIEAWQEEGVVELLGHVDDMAGLISSVDVVVLPSYREGLPTVLIEASACCKPLIATDVPGCRDVVQHGVNGLIVAVRDGPALAAAIDQLADDPARRLAMGKAARKRAVAEFDTQKIVRQIMDVYEEVRLTA